MQQLLLDLAVAFGAELRCGLSLTLRDLRDVSVLRDRRAATDDWRSAADAYAAEHDRYSRDLRRIQSWLRELWFGIGREAAAWRARALPLLADDPSRIADFNARGPEAPNDEAARRRLFAED
jgi:hypothetical protein